MDKNKPVSGELAALIPALAETMKFAVQAVRQSSALYEVLLAKGIVTKSEIDANMRSTADLSKSLMKLFDEGFEKMS